MNNYEKALKKIAEDEKCKPDCCYIAGPRGATGPTGPQGIAGPTGPTGPSGGAQTPVYGGIYNSSSQLVFFTAINNFVRINLNTSLPSNNVTTGSNTITINEAGTYEINYNVLLNTSEAVDVTIAVRDNGTIITQTRGSQTLAIDNTTDVSYDGRLSGSTFAILAAGDVLDLAIAVINNLPAGLDAVINGNANATLTVKKIK